MKDTNERPLPSDVPVEDTFTINGFLTAMHHPQGDMQRATLRFGQYAFNQYRRHHDGRLPHTRRINGNGPTKVYTATDLPLLVRTYNQWNQKNKGKETIS